VYLLWHAHSLTRHAVSRAQPLRGSVSIRTRHRLCLPICFVPCQTGNQLVWCAVHLNAGRSKAAWRGHTGTGERGRIGPFHAAATQRCTSTPTCTCVSPRPGPANEAFVLYAKERNPRDQPLLTYLVDVDVDVLALAGTDASASLPSRLPGRGRGWLTQLCCARSAWRLAKPWKEETVTVAAAIRLSRGALQPRTRRSLLFLRVV
jgi:hypothetical protein